MVVVLKSEGEYKDALAKTKGFGGKAMIIDFTATWCGPCQRIAPVYEQMSTEFPTVSFYKVDVDQCQEVAAACGVRAMPTFVGFFNGEKVDEVVGADPKKIKALVEQLAGMSGAAGGGAGIKLGGDAAGASNANESAEDRRAKMLAAIEARNK